MRPKRNDMFDKTSGNVKMGIEGAGPKIMIPAVIVFIVTAWISYTYRLTIPVSSEILTIVAHMAGQRPVIISSAGCMVVFRTT